LVSANEIPAGGEGRITVTVNSGSHSGPIRQTVRATTNIPGQEEVVLTITAQIVVDLEALPNLIQFVDNQTTRQIMLKSHIDTPIEISKLVSPSDNVKLSVSAMTIPAQGEVTLTAELPPDLPVGVFSEWIEVHSNLQSQPVMQIRLWANIQK
jgi:hypothetical protein